MTVPVNDVSSLDEAGRLAVLRGLEVLDSVPEPLFEAITAEAQRICGVPIALISLVDEGRQWFKSNRGLPGVSETPRSVAFCDHAIRGPQLLEVPDATEDPRFRGNPLVTADPNIRFYAGAPITMAGGERVGTVCVIDREPRQLDATQRDALMALSRLASICLIERVQQVALTRRLALSEARYRAIVEDQSELISLAQRDGTLTFVNAAYARHFGLQAEQMVGRNLIEFVHEADREAVRQHLEAVCVSGQVASGVNRMRAASGQEHWVAWINRPIGEPGQPVTAMQSVGRDITEQKRVEFALAESEQRYRRLYEATPAMLHSIDAQGRLLGVSDLWLQVLGYTRDEVVGRMSSEFLTPESQRKAREEVLPEFFRTGRCDRVAYQFVCKDGSLVDVRLSALLERDASGQPVHSLAVLEDVTEQNRLAAELGRTHAHLDAIVDNVPATLGYWDAQGITRFANREFQAAVGLPTTQIEGKSLRDIYEAVDPTGYATIAPHIVEVLKGRRQEFEAALLTTTGLRQLHMTLVPAQPGGGRVAGFYGLGYDITGRKALELRLSDSETRFRSLFDNLDSGFALHEVVTDGQGKVLNYKFLAMNAAYAEMTGLTPSQSIGRLVTEVVPDILQESTDWIGLFGRVALTGEPLRIERRWDAANRWFMVVAYRPAAGQFAVLLHDVTERRSAGNFVAGGA